MRIFLAGATGVLGRQIVPALISQGHQVTALTRSPERAAALHAAGAQPVVADIYDSATLAQIVKAAEPDVVMHQLTDLSGGSSKDNSRMRITGTRHLANAARAAGVRRCVAQSIAWAYEPGDHPADEQVRLDATAPAPRQVTVQGVTALETAVREFPEWVVLRYGLLYGPGTWYFPGGLMAVSAQSGKLAADSNVSSFVHVDDAAAAAVEALRWPSCVVNVCDDEPAPGREWVPEFCRRVGAPPPPQPDGAIAPDGWARGADNTYARARLHWTPRYPSWRDGFATIAAA